MDSSNSIGGASWKNLPPLTGTPAQRPSMAPIGDRDMPPVSIGDRIEMSAAPAAPAQAPAAPAAPAQAPAARPEITPSTVPMSLFADDASMNLMGVGNTGSAHPTTGLGVLAELDETSAVRAVDDGGSNNRFADLHLVGVSNAGQFLGNPGKMYLGI